MSHIRSQPRLVVAVALGLALVFGASSAVVATSFLRNGALKAVKIVTEDYHFVTSSATYVDVPSMSLTMSVPAGEKAVFLLTFSASDACYGPIPADFCFIQALLVNQGLLVPGQTVFDTTHGGPFYAAHSMQYLAGPYGAGQYTFKIQAVVPSGQATFAIGERTMSLIRSKV